METKLVHLMLLNGTNYAIWKVKCKMAFIRDGLWNIVNEAEIVPNSKADVILHAKYLSWKDYALVTIVLSVELSLLYLIGVWKKLADQFKKKKRGQIN